MENDEASFVSTIDFTNYDIYTFLGTLMEIANNNKEEYLHTFIGQQKSDITHKYFYLITQKYTFPNNRINLNNGYTVENKINKYINQHGRIVSSLYRYFLNLWTYLYD